MLASLIAREGDLKLTTGLGMRVSPETKERLDQLAQQTKLTRTTIIAKLIEKATEADFAVSSN